MKFGTQGSTLNVVGLILMLVYYHLKVKIILYMTNKNDTSSEELVCDRKYRVAQR